MAFGVRRHWLPLFEVFDNKSNNPAEDRDRPDYFPDPIIFFMPLL
jgi:hypothetical protein